MTDLDAIILRAIPVDPKCAIQESYNKERRRWLKEKINMYLEAQLSAQFNAQPVFDKLVPGVPAEANGRAHVQ